MSVPLFNINNARGKKLTKSWKEVAPSELPFYIKNHSSPGALFGRPRLFTIGPSTLFNVAACWNYLPFECFAVASYFLCHLVASFKSDNLSQDKTQDLNRKSKIVNC